MIRAQIKTFIDLMTYWIKEAPKGLDFARNYYPYGEGSDKVWYERTHERHIREIFSCFEDRSLPVLDIGCGKGYALYCLNKMGFTKLTGLEYTDYLSGIAKKNMKALGLEDKVEIIKGDAAEFEDYDEYQIIYMFHPFDGNIMGNVVKYAERSLARKPREFTVVYFHPMEHLLWDRSPVFRKSGQITIQYFNADLDVYYYEYDPDKLKMDGVSFREILDREMAI